MASARACRRVGPGRPGKARGPCRRPRPGPQAGCLGPPRAQPRPRGRLGSGRRNWCPRARWRRRWHRRSGRSGLRLGSMGRRQRLPGRGRRPPRPPPPQTGSPPGPARCRPVVRCAVAGGSTFIFGGGRREVVVAGRLARVGPLSDRLGAGEPTAAVLWRLPTSTTPADVAMATATATARMRRRWNIHKVRMRSASVRREAAQSPLPVVTKKSTSTLAPPIKMAATNATSTPDLPRPAR